MSVPRKIHDLLFLLSFVRANADPEKGVELEEVARRLGIPRARLLEYVDQLMMCGLPSADPGTYVSILVEDGRIYLELDVDHSLASPVRFTVQEAMGLSVALRMLVDAGEPGTAPAAERLHQKLRTSLSSTVKERVDELEPRVQVAADSGRDAPLLAALRRAVDTRHEVAFEYYSAYKDELRRRTVRPLLLVQNRGAWYLAAQDVEKGEVRHFRLDRIREVMETSTTFGPLPDLGNLEVAGDRLFVASAATVRTARIRVHAPLSRRLASEWSPTRIAHEPDGSIIATLEFVSPVGFSNYLLGLGGDIEVLDPPDLREALLARCQDMLGQPKTASSRRS